MNKATKQLAKEITTKLTGIDLKSSVEKMTTYIAVGHILAAMVADEVTYGVGAIQSIVALVPPLRNSTHAIMNLAADKEFSKFVLEEAATSMNSGQHLTLEHWCWLHRHELEEQQTESPARTSRKRPVAESDARQNLADGGDIKRGAWRRRELEWLRTESPSVAVLAHVEALVEERHGREMKDFNERVQEAIGMLEAL